ARLSEHGLRQAAPARDDRASRDAGARRRYRGQEGRGLLRIRGPGAREALAGPEAARAHGPEERTADPGQATRPLPRAGLHPRAIASLVAQLDLPPRPASAPRPAGEDRSRRIEATAPRRRPGAARPGPRPRRTPAPGRGQTAGP